MFKWRWCVVWLSVRLPGGFIYNFNSLTWIISLSLFLLQHCYNLNTPRIWAWGMFQHIQFIFSDFANPKGLQRLNSLSSCLKTHLAHLHSLGNSPRFVFMNKVRVSSYTQLFTPQRCTFQHWSSNSAHILTVKKNNHLLRVTITLQGWTSLYGLEDCTILEIMIFCFSVIYKVLSGWHRLIGS